VALRDFSLVLPEKPASIITIGGESGSGKTTLANAILGFVTLTSGQILYKGQDISRLSRQGQIAYRREVQAIFQDPYEVYNPFYRVKHVFELVIKRFRLATSGRDARQLIDEALKVVGMRGQEVLDKYPHQLSGGQRQRTMVARTLLLRPRMIVADEPVSMVDASLRMAIVNLFKTLRDELGIAIVYITHDLATADYISDRLIIMQRGRVVEAGDARTVLADPQHPYSRSLKGAVLLPDVLAPAATPT
jgi:peptide/nickel transport system ATP-binding protein